jgi:uncharacterized protein YigE (DUF2233 family)
VFLFNNSAGLAACAGSLEGGGGEGNFILKQKGTFYEGPRKVYSNFSRGN